MGAEETLQATVDALKAQVEKNEVSALASCAALHHAPRHTASLPPLLPPQKAMDTFYLLFAASLVFLMQAGFALLAAGSIRMKSVKNILLKSVMDACAGGIIWCAARGGGCPMRVLLRPAPWSPTLPKVPLWLRRRVPPGRRRERLHRHERLQLRPFRSR